VDPWPERAILRVAQSELGGPVELHIPREPVSLQAAGKKRRALSREIASLAASVNWFFTGDVDVSVQWTLSEKHRYESDRALDLDNILKPLLDGLSGPNGCLIDDTQVQHISVGWIDWTREDRQHLRIQIEALDPDEWMTRSFHMVEIRPAMCIPLPADISAEAAGMLLRAVERMFAGSDELMRMGVSWTVARRLRPLQRTFHRNKVREFEVISPDAYLSRF
jgi:Holliday junction resolvase RusA-like endonuclease